MKNPCPSRSLLGSRLQLCRENKETFKSILLWVWNNPVQKILPYLTMQAPSAWRPRSKQANWSPNNTLRKANMGQDGASLSNQLRWRWTKRRKVQRKPSTRLKYKGQASTMCITMEWRLTKTSNLTQMMSSSLKTCYSRTRTTPKTICNLNSSTQSL